MAMQTATFPVRKFWTVLSSIFLLQLTLFFQSCQKPNEPSVIEEFAGRKKPPAPPPPPPPFYFSNCMNPLYSATLVKGSPSNAAISKTYINSPGGSYAASTSATVNGTTVSALA